MKALIIQHVASEGLGNLEPVLAEFGFELEYIRLWRDDFSNYDPLSADLLIVLGGPIGVYNQDIYPVLTNEIEFVKKRTANPNLPTLGICLGSQIIAHTLGAKVTQGRNGFELGFHPLTNIDVSKPYFAELSHAGLKVLHWHGDTFDIPSGAGLVASSKQYPHQAYVSANHKILGLQFHLEVQPQDFEEWLISNAPELMSDSSIDICQLRSDNLQNAPQLQEHAVSFWRAWLKLVIS